MLENDIFGEITKTFDENYLTENSCDSPEQKIAKSLLRKVVEEALAETEKVKDDLAELKARCSSNSRQRLV